MFIKFDSFCYYYKVGKEYIKALDNVNLSIVDKDFLCIVGESGSGKSTILRSMLGQCEYVDGSLCIDDIPIENIDIKRINCSYLTQNEMLFPNLTVYENIAFPLRVARVSYEEIERRVVEIAKSCDINWLLTRKPKQLSAGQARCVALCSALVKRPALLLLDEPFSSLDELWKIKLRQYLKKIYDEWGLTVVMSTHDISEAFALATRIAVFQDGRVVESGSPDALDKNHKSQLLNTFFEEQSLLQNQTSGK